MRNLSKGFDIGRIFPIYAVEKDFLVSKTAEITAAYRLTLPPVFTLSKEDYEAMHAAWVRAIGVLPDYTIICKQDWFIRDTYHTPAREGEAVSFLEASYRKHFEGRPFLGHTCYLFITRGRKERSKTQSIDSLLLGGKIIPQEVNRRTFDAFADAVSQAEQILRDSALIKIERIGGDEIVGTKDRAGILSKYMNLSQADTPIPMQDLVIRDGEVMIGANHVVCHTLSAADLLPPAVGTHLRYEPYSTDHSDCLVSFAAPVGLLLTSNHVYTQVVFKEDSDRIKRELEKNGNRMYSLQQLSSMNLTNKAFIDAYLETAAAYKLTSVRAHSNVMAWTDNRDELRQIRNEVGSALAKMGCRVRHNTTDAPVLFWAGIPGNAGDFPREETYVTFLENALCLFASETNYAGTPPPKGIHFSDRITGRPVLLDLSDYPKAQQLIANGNKFVLGFSGSGKSFTMNHILRHYYEQDSHVILVDMGNSYEGLCHLIHEATDGRDGIYYTYTEEKPIAFNPFYTSDGVYDIEKRESLKTLILSLWRREGQFKDSERVTVEKAVRLFLMRIKKGQFVPSFNTFYEFVDTDFRRMLAKTPKFKPHMFDIDDFLYVLESFYKGGEYDYLLNAPGELDLLDKRFIVFEVDALKDNKVLFPVVTLVIMEAYINKMRRLKGVRKILMMEEAWKAIARDSMAEYILYLYKTVRKYYGEVIMVTQEIDDIIKNKIVKDAIINNSDCKILLDQKNYKNKFDAIEELLALSDNDKAQILSINRSRRPGVTYNELWIGLGGKQSAVYALEVSSREAWCFTTNEGEKHRLFSLFRQTGNMHEAIRRISTT